MPKLTRKQMFTDVPVDVAVCSHYAVTALKSGGWHISIRKVRSPTESMIIKSKDELFTFRAAMSAQRFIGVDIDEVMEVRDDPVEVERIFDPIRNPRNTKAGIPKNEKNFPGYRLGGKQINRGKISS